MNCPDKDVIIAYAQGNLRDIHKTERIKSHIESCKKCQNLLRTHLMLDKERHETHSERQEKHEDHHKIDDYDSDLGQRLNTRQVKTLKIIGIALIIVVMLSIFSLFIWQTHYKKNSSNIVKISGVDYRIWKISDSSDNSQLNSISFDLDSSDIDSHLVFLTPDMAKLLSQPKINDEFWQSLTKLLKDQGIQLPENPKILLIERSLFADIESGMGSMGGDLSFYFCENKSIIIQWAR